MMRVSCRAYAALFALSVWPQMAAAHVPGDGLDLSFVMHLLLALMAGVLLPFTIRDRSDRILFVFLALGGLMNAALAVLLFVKSLQDLLPEANL